MCHLLSGSSLFEWEKGIQGSLQLLTFFFFFSLLTCLLVLQIPGAGLFSGKTERTAPSWGGVFRNRYKSVGSFLGQNLQFRALYFIKPDSGPQYRDDVPILLLWPWPWKISPLHHHGKLRMLEGHWPAYKHRSNTSSASWTTPVVGDFGDITFPLWASTSSSFKWGNWMN